MSEAAWMLAGALLTMTAEMCLLLVVAWQRRVTYRGDRHDVCGDGRDG